LKNNFITTLKKYLSKNWTIFSFKCFNYSSTKWPFFHFI